MCLSQQSESLGKKACLFVSIPETTGPILLLQYLVLMADNRCHGTCTSGGVDVIVTLTFIMSLLIHILLDQTLPWDGSSWEIKSGSWMQISDRLGSCLVIWTAQIMPVVQHSNDNQIILVGFPDK